MHIPWFTRISFASSGAAIGVINNGIAYFLLIYYSQVLGLDAALAGAALMLALLFDAISDPLVGRWSDRLQHPWGRRHPFLVSAIVPISVSYYFLWNPPGDLSQMQLFSYLLGLTVLVRLCVTAHAVPFSALVPELTPDYDDRTKLINDSFSATWLIGTIMAVLMYAYWLQDTPDYPDGTGILRSQGYIDAALVSAIIILVACSYATFETKKYIPYLSSPPKGSQSLAQTWRETISTLKDRNFLAIALAGIFSAAASGTSTALWAYLQPFFWGFSSQQTSIILASQLFSTLIAFFILPSLSKGREKKPLLIQLSAISIFIVCGPIFLSLVGWFPAKGSELLFPVMWFFGVAQVILIVLAGVITSSMIADIVEHRAVQTQRREEGLLFSVQSFISKAATGIGVWAAGMMLSWVEFPQDALTTGVSSNTVDSLGWVYAPTLTLLYGIAIAALFYYQLTRAMHQQNITTLQKTTKQSETPIGSEINQT